MSLDTIPSIADTATVSMLAVGTWFIVGTPVAIYFTTIDLPNSHAMFAGWSFGGLGTAFMYIATFCE